MTESERWNLACYGGVADSEAAIISAGWITGPQTFLKVFTPVSASEVGLSQRHRGAWTESAYRLAVVTSDTQILRIDARHVWIDGLQLQGIAGAAPYRGIWAANNGADARIRLSNNLIRGEGEPSALTFSRGIQIWQAASSARFYLWNNIVYDLGSAAKNSLIVQGTAAQVVVYNNTFISGRAYAETPAVVIARNNIAFDGFGGDFQAASSHNATADLNKAAGSQAILLTSLNLQDYFTGSGDYRLVAAAPQAAEVIDAGTDLLTDPELCVLDDLVGTKRPQGLGFDLGAHELIP